ncbi:MAG: hypothetical protein OSB70_18510 [Myxococcota bacterium]|nr:hypothetical protein [Myxococcota bacterium]
MSASCMETEVAIERPPLLHISIQTRDAAHAGEGLADYQDGQLAALGRRGYAGVTSARPIEWEAEECLLLLAYSDQGRLVGGIRMQRHRAKRPMPCVVALRSYCEEVAAVVEEHASREESGEVCGLWVDSELAGVGLGPALTALAMSQAKAFLGRWAWGICPRALYPGYQRAGFEKMDQLGEGGSFWYAAAAERGLIIRADLQVSSMSDGGPRLTRPSFARGRDGRLATRPTRGELVIDYDLCRLREV